MRFTSLFTLCMALFACNSNPDQKDTGDTDDTDTGPLGYPSSYEEGSYRISALSLNELGDGVDQNGDDTPDNNLPNALTLVDLAIADQDFSLGGFNTLIATSIETKVLNILLDALHANQELTITVYSGLFDEENEVYSIDTGSFDIDGNPLSVFLGYFDTETDFGVSSEEAILPVTFIIEDGPLPVPLIGAQISGVITADGLSGQISGVIPGDDMVSNVVAPMIPEEGTGDMTKEEILEMVQGLTTNETLMDVPLSDGTRGISAAFRFDAGPQEFTDAPQE